jgi:outer membrane protein OmpA-like peptidoglycan-associated protein
MAAIRGSLKLRLACAVITVGLAFPLGAKIAFAAEQPSAEDIIRALKPVAKTTRSLSAPRSPDETQFIDTLRNRQTRSLSGAEREKIATAIEKKPSIDLEINFEYNSDKIGERAAPQVTALGQALSSAELKGSTFVVAGYTDIKGGDTFNQTLSERRADAVKRYLAEKYNIDATNLVTVGYGKTKLKNPSNPAAAENRRVQVVNMADK